MLTLSTPPAQAVRTAYFRSFASYRIPFEPEDELSFAETEGLNSYYVARFDLNGRLVEFDKILLQKLESRATDVRKKNDSPMRVLFMAERRGGAVEVGREIAYAETEELAEFFMSELAPHPKTLTLFRRELALQDRYSYWPNGVLAQRVLHRMDQSVAVWSFDEKGERLEQSIDPSHKMLAVPTYD
jgi:hypothetical protein